MFRRKGGDQEEAYRDRESSKERRVPSVVVEAPRRSAPSKTIVFHPDVPRGTPDPEPEDTPESTESEPNRLTVGRETTIGGGSVLACERLTVEGVVEASMPDGRLLEIVNGGVFRGTAMVDNADIAGSFEGDIKVKNRLLIRASGQVSGTIRYGQFEVERGGRIDGQVEYDPADREADLQPVALPTAADMTAATQGD